MTAHSISYRHDSTEIGNFSLGSYMAAFFTLFPFVSLPRSSGKIMLRYLMADVLSRVVYNPRESLLDLCHLPTSFSSLIRVNAMRLHSQDSTLEVERYFSGRGITAWRARRWGQVYLV